jgi:hypothetical protein
MTPQPRVLLVTPSGGSQTLAAALRGAGYELRIVADFAVAKSELAGRPELLITEVKLGAYNGLHLAIRANSQKTPAIVIGDADPVFEAEAQRQSAAYLITPIEPEVVVATARKLMVGSQHTRRSPRKQVPRLDVLVNDRPARLMDVSYEGIRLEAQDAVPHDLPSMFELRLPDFNFACQVQRVWSAPVQDEGSGVYCGGAVSVDVETAVAWRSLVDELPGLAVTL